METLQHIKAIKFDNYKIEFSTNIKGFPVAALSQFMTMGKNKGTYRRIESYYFKNEEKRAEWTKNKFKDIKERLNDKKERKQKLQEVRDNFVNPFKVGEIYYDSWGYEQTNIDFFVITEVKEKSVMIQAVGSTMCEGGRESGMSSNVKPNIDIKIGEPEIKIIQMRIWNDKPTFFIKSRHGWISKYTDGEKGVYSSWYA